MGCGKLMATPVMPLIAFAVYSTCAILVLFGIDTSLDIFFEMGALGNTYSRTMLYFLALVIFGILWFIDIVMLIYIWAGKLSIADEGCDNGCMTTFCGPIVGTIWLVLFWGAFVVLIALMLVIPVLAAILVTARYLCSRGWVGIQLLVMISQTLPGLDLALANTTGIVPAVINGTPPFGPPPMMPPPYPPPEDVKPPPPPPAPPTQPYYPPYCDAAVVKEAYTSGMLLSCTPCIIISQAIILASACTIIYGRAMKGGGDGIARTGDVTLNKLR